MDELTVKSVDVLGDAIMATQDADGNIWAGVSFFCRALGMNKGQKDRQTTNVQKDETLKRGCRKFAAGVFDQTSETVGMRIDFIPLWLAKINITKTMLQDHPDLADKLLEYQLKAKDILAAAFMQNQNDLPQTTDGKIALLAQGHTELKAEVDEIKAEVENIKSDLPILPLEAYEIEKAVRRKGVTTLGGKKAPAYNDRGLRQKLYNDLYTNLKHNFDVRTYKAIRRKDVEKAVQIINEYKPPYFLAEQIKETNAQQSFDLEGGAAE